MNGRIRVHPECMEFLRGNRHRVSVGSDILEFGSYNVNGSAREVFERGARSYVGVDVVEGPGVDVVADAATVDLRRQFDVVISVECLEHAPTWPQILINAKAHLRSGGLLLVTAACNPRHPHSAVDGHNMLDHEWSPEPTRGADDNREYYKNVDPNQLLEIANAMGFRGVDVTVLSRGDVQLVANA